MTSRQRMTGYRAYELAYKVLKMGVRIVTGCPPPDYSSKR